jgi:hypothetical protein
MLTNESTYKSVVSSILLPLIHDPILLETSIKDSDTNVTNRKIQNEDTISFSPSASVNILQMLLINADPSPTLISTLFSPLVPSLHALHAYLESKKTSNPTFRETVKSLLDTWARVVVTQEVIESCWSIIEGEGGYWMVDVAGEIQRTDRYVRILQMSHLSDVFIQFRTNDITVIVYSR